MSLVSIPDTTDHAANAAQQIAAQLNGVFAAMIEGHSRSFALLWSNQNATPQQVLDALQPILPASQLFTLGALLVDTILTAKPGALAPAQYTPPMTVAFNQDGSATLS